MKRDQVIPKRRKSSEIQSSFLPKDECLFCESSRRRTHIREEKLIECVTENVDQSIRAAAQRKQDHKILGKTLNGDLIAREAHYQTSCRKEIAQRQMIGISAVIKMNGLLKN